MTTHRWQTLLYGRTRRADRWWRVRPRLDQRWVDSVVHSVVAGGRDLASGPRFVLSRHGSAFLLGVATRADVLSADMNSDGTRPLYCFVGWVSNAPDVVPDLPSFEAGWVRWAGDVYQAWMPLDWDRHPTDVVEGREPPLERAPWTGTDSLIGVGIDLEDPRSIAQLPDGRPGVHPVAAGPAVWRRLVATGGDWALGVGLVDSSGDPDGVLTHIVASERQVEDDIRATAVVDDTGTRSAPAPPQPHESGSSRESRGPSLAQVPHPPDRRDDRDHEVTPARDRDDRPRPDLPPPQRHPHGRGIVARGIGWLMGADEGAPVKRVGSGEGGDVQGRRADRESGRAVQRLENLDHWVRTSTDSGHDDHSSRPHREGDRRRRTSGDGTQER